jgi:hypothetical protein
LQKSCITIDDDGVHIRQVISHVYLWCAMITKKWVRKYAVVRVRPQRNICFDIRLNPTMVPLCCQVIWAQIQRCHTRSEQPQPGKLSRQGK